MIESQEYRELKEMIEAVGGKVDIILTSLKRCQARCVVDNPPGRWRSLGQAIVALIRF